MGELSLPRLPIQPFTCPRHGGIGNNTVDCRRGVANAHLSDTGIAIGTVINERDVVQFDVAAQHFWHFRSGACQAPHITARAPAESDRHRIDAVLDTVTMPFDFLLRSEESRLEVQPIRLVVEPMTMPAASVSRRWPAKSGNPSGSRVIDWRSNSSAMILPLLSMTIAGSP
jgi:hypothetical protein